MLNVANLYPEFFEAVLDGSKSTEFRLRRRPDPRLEAIQAGELVVFLECGSDRALLTFAEHIECRMTVEGFEYQIHLGRCRHLFRIQIKKLQGWSRRERL